MESLRTPEDRFRNLPGYPYSPGYLEDLAGFEGLRLHYLDEGPEAAEHTFLCLHGQPTWSYLYRKMLPIFVAAGHRVVAPDLFGFGKSDKPTDDHLYSFDFHRVTLMELIRKLDLQRITLVAQDWGGILGLTLPMDLPGRFQRMILMNTALTTGDQPLTQGFLEWREWCRRNPDLDVARLMSRAVKGLSKAEAEAYAAPFPDGNYKAGVRRFPELVPDHPEAPGASLSRRASRWLGSRWDGPVFLAVGVQDPVLGPPAMSALTRAVNGCLPPLELPDVGHFVQESGEIVARQALAAFARL
ncbi:MAG: alpha/beta fold hydrolase [Acidobacteria bacterium]|nr:alpha/beta fold hydrolase [Acidobacteriota bacterium]